MERRVVIRPVLLLLSLSIVVWVVGCASTGASIQDERSSGEIADIDEL